MIRVSIDSLFKKNLLPIRLSMLGDRDIMIASFPSQWIQGIGHNNIITIPGEGISKGM
jgi:hypothetical protein